MFLACVAGGDAGGLYLIRTNGGTNGENLPVRECRFISCVAHGKVSGSQTNDADGGGLIYWSNDYTFGICNALFARCESKLRAGGTYVTINSDHFDGIIRFCFYCENIAQNGRNAFLGFNGTNGQPWSIIFFHSYTSDRDLTNSLLPNDPALSSTSNNWLPSGTTQ